MKKLFCLLTVVLLSLSLIACSSKEDSNPTEDSATDGGSDGGSNPSEVITISIGMSPDYPPYESLDTNGNLIGFDVEMLKEMETLLYEAEGKTYKFDIVQMNFDNIIVQMQGGQLDAGVSGFTYSEEREGAVQWSTPYCNSKQVVMVLADSAVNSLSDLDGKLVAAQTGTTGEYAAQDSFGEENVTSIQSVIDMIPGLDANQYDAVVLDSAVANSYVSTGKYKVLDETLVDEMNYIVVANGKDETLSIINKGIELFVASDKYSELCEEYQLSPIEK